MVILFSGRKSKIEKEIIEILSKYGGNYISDKFVGDNSGTFTFLSVYKKSEIKLKKGIAVFIDDTKRFQNQNLPIGVIGICEDLNHKALEIFKNNNIAVISCGINSKNTVTLSSYNSENLLATLQRTLTDNFGNEIDPCEYRIKLSKEFHPFSIMASIAVLLLNGILPHEFWIIFQKQLKISLRCF